jgi:hypothetical protein
VATIIISYIHLPWESNGTRNSMSTLRYQNSNRQLTRQHTHSTLGASYVDLLLGEVGGDLSCCAPSPLKILTFC